MGYSARDARARTGIARLGNPQWDSRGGREAGTCEDLLALPDHLVGAARVAVDDAVRVSPVTDVEVELSLDRGAERERPLRKAVNLIAFHDGECRAVHRASVEVRDVRGRVAADTRCRDVGVQDAIVLAAGRE